jgi:hypothetical protein
MPRPPVDVEATVRESTVKYLEELTKKMAAKKVHLVLVRDDVPSRTPHFFVGFHARQHHPIWTVDAKLAKHFHPDASLTMNLFQHHLKTVHGVSVRFHAHDRRKIAR